MAMELRRNNDVFFEEMTHSYTNAQGDLLIGVTTLMAKHGLAPDYGNIPKAVLDKAAAEGTAVHRLLQSYDEGGLVPTTPLLEAYRALGFKHIESEYLVSDNEIVATSIDKVYEAGKNLVDLADVKTTQKVHRRALEWQLGIGKVLLERQNPGIKVRNCFCIWCDKKGMSLKGVVPIEPVSEAEVEALLEAERDGLIYVDEYREGDITEAVTDQEIASFVANASKIAELENTLKMLKEADEAIKGKVLRYMEDNNLAELEAPGGVFKMRKGSEQVRVDSARLQKEFPAVYNKVTKTITVKGSVTFKINQ